MSNHVLIITGDATDAKILQRVLDKAKDGPFVVEWVTQLSDGLARLDVGGIDAILVDLSLPDSDGIATFDALFEVASAIPIMTLSPPDDEVLAIEAVQRGAQGFLSKGHFSSYLVPQSLRNIIQRKAVEESVFLEQARAEITLNSITDAVIRTDMSGNVDYLNFAAESMTGWSREDARGQPIGTVMPIIDAATREAAPNPIKAVLDQNLPKALSGGVLLRRRDGQAAAIEHAAAPIHDLNQSLAGAVIVFRDVTATQAMSAKMAHLAQHDFLTNLPNRVLLNDRIAQAIAVAKRNNTMLAVLFLDLDNFKHINDSLGHAVGDQLLQSVSQRLSACVRDADTVSRQGGDEFIVLVHDHKAAQDVARIADKIIASLTGSHAIEQQALHVTTSIGISLYPSDGEDAVTLVKNADTAMYQAKENGRNNFQFFKSAMHVRAVERQAVEADLRLALERGEFILHYQPKVNLHTGKITGAEALLRWQHPKFGMLLPERFIQIAEHCGLIVPIGRWVLRQACAQAREWIASGLPPLSMAVNVCALEFRRPDFVEVVRTILHETDFSPRCLQLEITETVLMRDAQSSAAILKELKEMGVLLAVDDFGTGYSSLSYLKQFPIDVLKIDQSFVQGIGSVKDDSIIVSAVIGMGNNLKKQVVAEGIETQGQLDFLRAQHCEEGQGYLLGRPLNAECFATMVTTGISQTADA